MTSKHKQRGLTLMGFIMIMIVAAGIAIIAMNLVPVYSEANSVKTQLKHMADEPGVQNMDQPSMQKALQKRFDIDYIESVTAKQALLVRDKETGASIVLDYEVRKPLVYNLDFVAKFENKVSLSGAPTGGP
jgi:hypothetical protein